MPTLDVVGLKSCHLSSFIRRENDVIDPTPCTSLASFSVFGTEFHAFERRRQRPRSGAASETVSFLFFFFFASTDSRPWPVCHGREGGAYHIDDTGTLARCSFSSFSVLRFQFCDLSGSLNEKKL
ncbi:hypothetical protein BHM03_00039374 [Ensete ventricosum]|nr:hypothetical protein BHM03_00039374 [Ensete ventricosum]